MTLTLEFRLDNGLQALRAAGCLSIIRVTVGISPSTFTIHLNHRSLYPGYIHDNRTHNCGANRFVRSKDCT